MEPRTQNVKRRFDRTGLYLHKDFNIELRAFIVRRLLGTLNNCNVLDLGPGNGRLSLQFLEEAKHITFVDLSPEMLDVARRNTPPHVAPKTTFVTSDLADYDPNQQFDVILCIGVLGHVASLESAVARISALLKPGGRCVLQITDHGHLSGRLLGAYARANTLRSHGYLLNETTFASLCQVASRNELTLLKEHHYTTPPPGIGRVLPNSWLFRYELFTLENEILSRFGSECVALFGKEVGTADRCDESSTADDGKNG